MLRYTGGGPNFFRAILAPFDPDPDWADPTVPRPSTDVNAATHVCWLMDFGSFVPRRAVLSFAFFNNLGAELSGGTANMYEFHVLPPSAFQLEASAPTVVRKGESVAAATLAKDWVMTNVGPVPHGIRLDTIVAPAGAVVLKISVMELPQL